MREMADWVSVVLEALGGHEVVSLIAYWVITKWNLGSVFSRRQCELDRADENGTFNTLSKQELGFDVLTHGDQNQDDVFDAMVEKDSKCRGLSTEAMNPNTEHHENMVKNVARLQDGVSNLSSSIASMKTDRYFEMEEHKLRQALTQAATDLANCSNKDEAQKEVYRKLIAKTTRELSECSALWRDTKVSRADKEKNLRELSDRFEARLAELAKREGLMAKLGSLVGVRGSKAQDVLKLSVRSKN